MSGFSDFQQENTGWRTMLVVPELEFELEMLVQTFSIRKVPMTGFLNFFETGWELRFELPLLALLS
jgi:hypothetical protein